MNTPSKIDRGTLVGGGRSRSLTLSFGLLRRHLWLWPLLAAVMLGAAFFWIRTSVETAAKRELAKSLTTILDADVAALNIWMKNHRREAVNLAGDPRVRKLSVGTGPRRG